MKRFKSHSSSTSDQCPVNDGFDFDMLTSIVTEEKESTNRAHSFRTSTKTLDKNTMQRDVKKPALEFIPQEWAEKLYPRLSAAAERECRKVYIGGLGAATTDGDVKKFLDHQLRHESMWTADGIVNIEMRNDSERRYRFCFVELAHEAIANAVIELHDHEFTNCEGKLTYIKVGRTKDYPGNIPKEKIPEVAFVANLPRESINKDELMSMFSDAEIGTASHIWIVREHSTLIPNGSVFIKYDSSESVQKLISALQNEQHEGNKLVVREATQEDRYNMVKNKQISISDGLLTFLTLSDPPASITSGSMNEFFKLVDSSLIVKAEMSKTALIIANAKSVEDNIFSQILGSVDGRGIEHVFQTHLKSKKLAAPTRALVLLNLVDENELEEDEDYQNLKEDIEEELIQHGLLEELVITRFPPRAPTKLPALGEKHGDPQWIEYEKKMIKFHNELNHPVLGHVGRVFAIYASVPDAMNAQKNVSGRTFNGRTVITTFLDEKYLRHDAPQRSALVPVCAKRNLAIR